MVQVKINALLANPGTFYMAILAKAIVQMVSLVIGKSRVAMNAFRLAQPVMDILSTVV